MSTTQEFNRKVQKVQGQTLDTARKAQDVVVEAVTAWTVIANAIPGYDKFVNQFPRCHRGHRFPLRLRRADPSQPA